MDKINNTPTECDHIKHALKSRLNSIGLHDYGIYHHVALIYRAGRSFEKPRKWNESLQTT